MRNLSLFVFLFFSSTTLSGEKIPSCFNKVCRNSDKKELEENGFKSLKNPLISRKNSKSDKLLRENKKSTGIKEIVDIDSNGKPCRIKVSLKNNDSAWKKLKEVLEKNQIITNFSSIKEKINKTTKVKFIRERLVFDNYQKDDTPLTIQVSQNHLEITFYFDFGCDPSSKILEEPPLPN